MLKVNMWDFVNHTLSMISNLFIYFLKKVGDKIKTNKQNVRCSTSNPVFVTSYYRFMVLSSTRDKLIKIILLYYIKKLYLVNNCNVLQNSFVYIYIYGIHSKKNIVGTLSVKRNKANQIYK